MIDLAAGAPAKSKLAQADPLRETRQRSKLMGEPTRT